MNIDQYPVNFGYGEKTTINGVPYTHRGNDYPLNFEPVKLEGIQIGVSGASGKVTGPHVHVQAGKDEFAQETINPTPYVGKPGVVVKTGFGSEWGNYVCIRVDDVNVFYCHLSAVSVQIGQKISKEEDMPITTDQLYSLIRGITQREPTQAEVTNKDYLNDPGLAIDTFWNNGGKEKYQNKDKSFKEAGEVDGKPVYRKQPM